MIAYAVADPAQDNVAFSLASVMNQANQVNADAMLENSYDGEEPMNTNENDNPQQPFSNHMPFRVDSLVLALFPWITPLPMSTSLSEVYPAEHFAHVRLLTPFVLPPIKHTTVIGKCPRFLRRFLKESKCNPFSIKDHLAKPSGR